MRVSSTMHDDNWHSKNPQPYLVKTGSNVTLTCTAKGPTKPYIMNWYDNSTFLAECTNGTQSTVKTCNVPLWWPHVRGNYSCQAKTKTGKCTFTLLKLKVAGESRLIQVSNYYYYCYCYYYYYYIIIIKGPMLTNFACIALRR